jgi:hypothetical protein
MTSTSAVRVARFVFLSDALDAGRDGQRVGWRLVAANNRVLGRSVRTAESLEGSRLAAWRLHRGARTTARTAATFDSRKGRWTWTVSFDDVPVAVCSHPYLRRVECLRALGQFLIAAESADPDAGVVRCFGPRTLHEYDLAVEGGVG